MELLTDRTQSVTVNNKSSDSLPVTSGIPQGSVPGPLLFLIYTSDLPFHVPYHIRMFADACVIYCTLNSTSHQRASRMI